EAMASTNNRYELIRGELAPTSPTGGRHGKITVKLSTPLAVHVSTYGLGDVFGAETGFVRASDPDVVLAPNGAFVAAHRIPPEEEIDRFPRLAPDLVVEAVSPSDTATEVFDKVLTYLDTCVRLVWIIEPRRRTVTVWAAGRTGRILTETDELDGGDVLPAFRLPVSEIFR
ncbi:MAG: Uma2 family endonuclease, partial [Chloroflexota bacterium]|nr:Uma2 family endonuclease [Chloroflexota bacterium]